MSIGIHVLIYFVDDPKAVINGAVNWLKKLKNLEIISSYKFLSKTFTVLLVLKGGSHFR